MLLMSYLKTDVFLVVVVLLFWWVGEEGGIFNKISLFPWVSLMLTLFYPFNWVPSSSLLHITWFAVCAYPIKSGFGDIFP